MTLEDVIAAALQFPQVTTRLKNALVSDLVVANVYHRQITEFLADFHARYGSLPKQGDWQAWIETLPERDRDGVREQLRSLQSRDLSSYTPEFVGEHAVEVLRESAAKTAVGRLQRVGEGGRVDAIRELANQVERVETLSIHDLANLRDVDRYLRPKLREDRVSTGIEKLDRILGGGWGKELVMLLADAKVGKSIALMNFGAVATLYGRNVFHISLEIHRDPQAVRYYRRMSESDKDRVRAEPGEVRDDVRHWWRFAQGELHLMYKDAYSVTPQDLKGLVHTHAELHWVPDVIIIDYLDLMAPPKGSERKSRYQQLGEASHLVRGLCDEYDATVLTCTQATRPTGKDFIEHLSLSQMGDSYEKVRAADVIPGLVQTPDELKKHIARIQMLAVRDSPGGGMFPVFFNKDLMLLRDLDHPDTRRIMQGLGMEVPSINGDGEEETP